MSDELLFFHSKVFLFCFRCDDTDQWEKIQRILLALCSSVYFMLMNLTTIKLDLYFSKHIYLFGV